VLGEGLREGQISGISAYLCLIGSISGADKRENRLFLPGQTRFQGR